MTLFEILGQTDKNKDITQFFLKDAGDSIELCCHSVIYDTNYKVVSISKTTGLLHRCQFLPYDIGMSLDCIQRIKEDNE